MLRAKTRMPRLKKNLDFKYRTFDLYSIDQGEFVL